MVHHNSKEFPADPRQLPTTLEHTFPDSSGIIPNNSQLQHPTPNSNAACLGGLGEDHHHFFRMAARAPAKQEVLFAALEPLRKANVTRA